MSDDLIATICDEHYQLCKRWPNDMTREEFIERVRRTSQAMIPNTGSRELLAMFVIMRREADFFIDAFEYAAGGMKARENATRDLPIGQARPSDGRRPRALNAPTGAGIDSVIKPGWLLREGALIRKIMYEGRKKVYDN